MQIFIEFAIVFIITVYIYTYIHNIYISLPVAILITRYTIDTNCCYLKRYSIFNYLLTQLMFLIATELAPEENIKFNLSICLIF